DISIVFITVKVMQSFIWLSIVTAWPGSSVILPCELSPTFDAKPLKVCWYRHDNFFTYKPALFYKDHKTQEDFVDPHYRGRVSLIGELEKGNLSLRLERVTPEDRGEYVCCVSNGDSSCPQYFHHKTKLW
uniref:Ig-like domain-containing protein n=1 Tax=Esox lucius TaxID=8010 RepID=A0AAY5KDW4_ESOLU